MKRNVTFMLAVFTLLACLIAPIGMWGQKPVNNNSEMTRTESVVTWNATAANNFGSTISQVNGTNTGSISTGSFSWNYVNTLTYLKSNKSDHQSFLNTGFIQIGSSNAYHRLELSTSAIPGTIKSVSVECSSANGAHKLTIVVGSTNYKNAVSTPSGQPTENGNYVITGTGNASGAISILLAPGSGALYIKSISVTYEETNLTPTAVTIEPNSGFSNDLNNSPSGGLLVATVTANNQPIQASVTWASSNTNVATVNANGVVTLVAVGQTDITATYAGDNTYAGSVGTYQLNVINSAPYATATPSTLNSFSYNEGYGPSAIQTISVEGANLAGNVTVELDGLSASSFEISLDGTNWNANGSISLTPTNLTLAATNISVRMKAGLVTGVSYSDQLRVKYNGSNMASINLSGSVDTITILSVSDVLNASSLPSGTVYVSGIVSSFYGDDILDDGNNYRYYISEDGVEEDEIRVYKGKGLNNQPFANVDDVHIGDQVIICGELSEYNNMVQLNAGNYIISLTRPESYTLTVSSLSHANIYVFAGNESEMLFEGEDSASVLEGANVMLSVEEEYGYQISSLMVDGVECVSQIDGGMYVFHMPSHNVTVTASATRLPYYTITFMTNGILDTNMEVVQGDAINVTSTLPAPTAAYIPTGYEFLGWYDGTYALSNTAPDSYVTDAFEPQGDVTLNAVFAELVTPATPDTWTKVNDLSTVTAGVYALIDADGYAFNGTISSGHGQHATGTFSFTNDVATSAPSGTCELTLATSGNGFTMCNADNGYLYATKAGSGGLAWHDSEDSYWYYGEVSSQYNWVYNKSYSGNKAVLRVYNHTFRTYANNSNNPIYLAKKTAGAPAVYENYRTSLTESSDPLTISGYGQSTGGYRLIASPVYVDPANVTNMTTGTYDLYYFDQTQTNEEWRNYKANSFTLVPGKGYLYASQNNTTLTFTGAPYNGNGEVTLSKVPGVKFSGWNLIGNPRNATAILKDADNQNQAYYTINQTNNEVAAGTLGADISAMEGVFVVAENDGDVVTFVLTGGGGAIGILPVSPEEPAKTGGINLNISKPQGLVIDRAIVRFDNGGQLPKFQLNPNNTKIYFTENNKDFAVVRSANEGEMPVNFRAAENGTYSLSVEVSDTEMAYLHLIDNKTGVDVDLLANPSYTFEANANDYESRFRLVFNATGVEENNTNETFAFFNGSEWVIDGPSTGSGTCILQVIDMMGRVLSSEQINGNTAVNLNQAAGIYVLRLVNGENAMVQKVVVR